MRSFFNRNKYDAREIEEINAVRELYNKVFSETLFPNINQTPLALVENKHDQPVHSLRQTDLCRLNTLAPSGDLFNFADGAVLQIIDYLKKRKKRWFSWGYNNDPLNLTALTLRQLFAQLAIAPSNESTATQLAQIRQYIVALMQQHNEARLFSCEPQKGIDTFGYLLYQLHQTVKKAECLLEHRLALMASREAFKAVGQQQSVLLGNLIQYLFYICANSSKDRVKSFSLTNAQNNQKALDDHLKTKSGALLCQLMFNPYMQALLTCSQPIQAHKSVPIFKEASTDMPLWLDQKGKAQLLLVMALSDFKTKRLTTSYQQQHGFNTPKACYQHSKVIKKDLAPSFQSLPICLAPHLSSDSLAPFVQLHGLIYCLIRYNYYTEKLWILAGYGGDALICHTVGQHVLTFLRQARTVAHKIDITIQALNQANNQCYSAVVGGSRYSAWQANYQQALTIWETTRQLLASYKTSLSSLEKNIRDKILHDKKIIEDKDTLAMVDEALAFSGQCVQVLGLAGSANQQGREAMEKKETDAPVTMLTRLVSVPAVYKETVDWYGIQQTVTKSLPNSAHLFQPDGLFTQIKALLLAKPRWYDWLFGHTIKRQFSRDLLTIFEEHQSTLLLGKTATQQAVLELSQSLESLIDKILNQQGKLWRLFHSGTLAFLKKVKEISSDLYLYVSKFRYNPDMLHDTTYSITPEPDIRSKKVLKFAPTTITPAPSQPAPSSHYENDSIIPFEYENERDLFEKLGLLEEYNSRLSQQKI